MDCMNAKACGLRFSVLAEEANRLCACREYEKAENLYTQFIEHEQDSSESRRYLALARNNRGHVRYLRVDFRGAVDDYTEAIQLNPALTVSWYNRGQVHYRMGRLSVAITDLKKAVQLDPCFEDACENLRQAEEDLYARCNT